MDGSIKLWRYLTLDKFVWLLEKSKLWHTRLDRLGDRFEGSFPKAYLQMRDANQSPGLPPEIERARNEAEIYTKFVTCWHASLHESAAMWNLYSTERAGVAIVSTPLRIREAVDLTPYTEGIISPVEYKDFETEDMILRPISKSFGRRANPALLKRKEFEHENEIRGLIYWQDYTKMPNPIPIDKLVEVFRLTAPHSISPDVDLTQLIEEIYVSPLASSCFKETVTILAERHRLEDRIRLSKLGDTPRF